MAYTTIEVEEYSDTVPIGEVIRTDPPAGTPIFDPDQVFTLYISKGPFVGAGGGVGARGRPTMLLSTRR